MPVPVKVMPVPVKVMPVNVKVQSGNVGNTRQLLLPVSAANWIKTHFAHWEAKNAPHARLGGAMETSAGSVGSTPEVKDSDPSKDLGQGKEEQQHT